MQRMRRKTSPQIIQENRSMKKKIEVDTTMTILVDRLQTFDPNKATVFTSDMTKEEIIAKIMEKQPPKGK